MRLTIKNLSRLNEIGDSTSPFIATNLTIHADRYELPMQHAGRSWNVVLYRDILPAHNKYRMLVQLIGKMHFETTAVDRAELNSPGITLSIIESLMNIIIKKIKA